MLLLTTLSASLLAKRAHAADAAPPDADTGADARRVDAPDATVADAGAEPDGGAGDAGATDAASPSAEAGPPPPPPPQDATTVPTEPAGPPPPPSATPAPDESVTNVVVTGTRTPEQSQRATVKTDVVTRQEAERRGATNVAEALASQPGVQVNPGAYNFLGYVSPIQIQGFDLGRVLILEDGEPVVGDVGGAIDLAAIPIADIDRIEIVTGPTSALYGSSAIGGVVNIITARPRGVGPGARARAEYWNHHGVVLQGTGRQRGRRRWIVADLALARQDGVAEAPGLPDYQIPATARTLVGLRAGSRLGAGGDLQIRGRWIRQSADGLESRSYPGLGLYLIDSPSTINRFALHALCSIRLGAGSSLRLSLAGQQAGRVSSTIPRGSPLGETQRTSQAMQSFEATSTIADGPRTWVAGTRVDLQRAEQDLERTEDVGGVPTTSTTRELAPRQLGTAAAYGQLQWKPHDKLSVLPGARAEYHGQFGGVVAPRLALAFRPSQALVARASAGRGFRAPSAKELGFNFDHSVFGYRVVGNPSLTPERSWGVNGDASWNAAGPLTVRVGAFASRVDDLIDIDIATGMTTGTVVTYSYRNFQRVLTAGAQAGAGVQVAGRVRADIAYDYLWTRDDVNDVPLPGRPPHTLTVSAQALLPAGFEVSLRARAVSDAYVDGDVRSPGYVTVDARVSRPLWSGVALFAGVRNLGDVRQESGRVGDLRPPLGRVLYLGVTAALPEEVP